jgi:AI-2 transport protein TqsA
MNSRFEIVVYGTVFALAIGWILYIGKSVFVPIVFSILVVYVVLGLTRLLFKLPLLARFVPLHLGYLVAALAIALALAAIASLVAANLGKVAALAPQYSASLLNAIQAIADKLGMESVPTWSELRREVLAQVGTQRLVGSTVLSVSSIASTLVIVFLYVAFLLIEQRSLAAKIARISNDPRKVAQIQKVVVHINTRIGTYLALKTLVSAVQGVVAWVILSLLGMDFAVFWAVLIGLLNYVPYIGSVLGVAFPVAFATMQFADYNAVPWCCWHCRRRSS